MNPGSNLPAPSPLLPTVLPTAPWTKECSLPVDVGLAHLTPPVIAPAYLFFGRSPKIGQFVLCLGLAWPRANGEFSAVLKDRILFSFPSWSFAIPIMGVMLTGSKHEADWIAKAASQAAVRGGTEKAELCTSSSPWMHNRMEEAPAQGRSWISPACPCWPEHDRNPGMAKPPRHPPHPLLTLPSPPNGMVKK